MKTWYFLLLIGFAFTARAHDFVGPLTCQGCHQEAFKKWLESAHAKAREALSPAQARDARCLSCHSPEEASKKVVGVTCESCHGGGQYYAQRQVMKDAELARLAGLVDPTERACRSCHTATSPSLKPFIFSARLKEIDHWTEERQRRAAATHP